MSLVLTMNCMIFLPIPVNSSKNELSGKLSKSRAFTFIKFTLVLETAKLETVLLNMVGPKPK